MLFRLSLLIVLVCFSNCKQANKVSPISTLEVEDTIAIDMPHVNNELPKVSLIPKYDNILWTEISADEGFHLDLKYATEENFTKQIIYPCARCFLRPQVAKKLRDILSLLNEKNLSIKLFDCYRPRPAQQKLWDIIPDATYVADPKKGSMHNRGLAVDMTICDGNGQELDMGTAFDHFGRESRHNFYDLADDILTNRALLKGTMEEQGFNSIKSEWWHYSLLGTGHKISDWEWDCPD